MEPPKTLDYSPAEERSKGRTKLRRVVLGFIGLTASVIGFGLLFARAVFWWLDLHGSWQADSLMICTGVILFALGIRAQAAAMRER